MKIFHLNSSIPRKNSNIFIDMCYNTGNFVPAYAMLKILGIDTLEDEDHISNFWESEIDINHINTYDHVILYMQDQIKENISYYDPNDQEDFIRKLIIVVEQITVPLTVVGLGISGFENIDFFVENVIQDYKKEMLQLFSRKCKNIGVRGELTREVLNKLGIYNVACVGCPSIFYHRNEPPLICRPTTINKIALGGLDANGDSRFFKILQDETYGCRKEVGTGVFFRDLESWIKYLKENADLFIGTRIHGSIVAILSGIPAVCTSSDIRVKEMCEIFSIPLYPSIDKEEILEYLAEDSIDFSLFNKNYSRAYQKFKNFLIDENLIMIS